MIVEFKYTCSDCGRDYAIDPKLMVCPDCSQAQEKDRPLRGVLEVHFKGAVWPDFDIFELLPVDREFFPPVPLGGTPLWEPRNLRNELGFPNLFIKDEGANPTGSLKDRASILVSAFAASKGVNEIVAASTGNAGSSMAGIGAAAGQKITLFLPKTAPQAKLVQALQYGADVYRVDGTYDDAYDLSLEYSKKYGGMNRNTAYNPMTLEGKKTASLELFKQLGQIHGLCFCSHGRRLHPVRHVQRIPGFAGTRHHQPDAHPYRGAGRRFGRPAQGLAVR